ncbi:cilia- and flagella-associated protein 251-like [Pistacia vera]|uniref:cilia- and flagella-associated protein 251-like n=1 Tax=Pistacia vera TaxID=55513 RepID=UPI00126364D5|nr:cilia- and flagella-associated protein 251-like [Pistacia vera]XP_031282106.1 cilia- and flagella-associated protein 251-like [Pistacia vera]
MELELGLKITHNRDDLTSKMADFRITKESSGPLFMSTETDSKFILIGHLKGFRRENIDIEINEAGNRIAIGGKKPVQEMVLLGWIMVRKEVEVKAFRKVFRIPERVKLDKIKAKLNDETSTLTIVMPKLDKGICGVGIEEVKEEEEEEEDRGRTEAEEVPGIEKAKEEIQKESEKPIEKEETDQVVEREVPETIEQKNESLEDSGQVLEKASDQGQPAATKAEEFPGGDYAGEAVKETPEELTEEIASEEQKVDGDESRTFSNEAEKVPERVKEPEVKSLEENDQVVEQSPGGPEIEPQASTEMNQATGSVEPHEAAEKESDRPQKTESPPTEETQRENHPEERAQVQELEEQVPSPENIESKIPGDDQMTAPTEPPSSPSNEIEEEETTKEKHQLQNEKPGESPRQEPGEEVQESTKPESHQEPEQQETSNLNNLADQTSEETQGKEIKEKETREEISKEKVEEHESLELEKQNDLSEEASQMKKHVEKMSKMCPPLVVAGSALLVSILVLVFHFIRAKKT